jgi:hypothetical protein
VLNLNDLICAGKGRCQVVLNDMIIFRDHHHLTATFSRSLAPPLERALDRVLSQKNKKK